MYGQRARDLLLELRRADGALPAYNVRRDRCPGCRPRGAAVPGRPTVATIPARGRRPLLPTCLQDEGVRQVLAETQGLHDEITKTLRCAVALLAAGAR
jgi:hypothetical protein